MYESVYVYMHVCGPTHMNLYVCVDGFRQKCIYACMDGWM